MKIKIQKLKCKQCGHEWIPRNEKIYKCPKCQSVKWNEEAK